MKRVLTLFALLLTIFLLAACTAGEEAGSREDGRLKVVATLFPQYDFAREIGGEQADVRLLLPPGADSHAYEPSPSDIIAISQADVFLYTGPEMEVWAHSLLDGINRPDMRIVDLSEGLTFMENLDGDDHEGHDHLFDPHIWTSPVIAQEMARAIGDAFIEADPENASGYKTRTMQYIEKLSALDQEFREIVADGSRKDFIFGSRFACLYFAREYGLKYDSAFATCAGETEPSAQALARLITRIQEDKIPVIFYQELTDSKPAIAVAEATGAKPLLFHSCHNVTQEELDAGASYISLMEQNAVHLKEGLS